MILIIKLEMKTKTHCCNSIKIIMTVVIKRGDAFLLTMMMIMQVILGFSGFLVFAALRLVDLSACSLLGFWVFWLLQLLGFLAFFLAGVSPTLAVVKPFTTMFALGEGCEGGAPPQLSHFLKPSILTVKDMSSLWGCNPSTHLLF